MQELITVTAIILKAQPVGESDRRVTLLTNSRGKIGAFATGARKPNSRFSASTIPFAFGTFKLYEGRDSYRISDTEITDYFEAFRTDVEGMAYASYFAEIADYYCRENNDEREMMKLFYLSLKALLSEAFPRRLIKAVYELRSIVANGEFPGTPEDRELTDGCRAALRHIAQAPVEKLFTFTLAGNALDQLCLIGEEYRSRYMDHTFMSLEILNTLC